MSDEGFLSRWARRKAQVQGGEAAAESLPAEALAQRETEPAPSRAAEPANEPTSLSPPAGRGTEGEGPAVPSLDRETPRLPTMDDVAHLTRTSDYARFLAPGVDDSVMRAAMKKLFSDPHFNVMDGLDVYIDDYNKTNPLTEADLRKMVQSQFLRLFEEDEPASKEALANPDGAATAPVSQCHVPGPAETRADDPSASAVPPDENADLRLQPDDAAGRAGAVPRTRPAGR